MAVAPVVAAAPGERPGDGEVAVAYVGSVPILVRAASGRSYTFAPARRVRNVPAADAAQLLTDALFERASH